MPFAVRLTSPSALFRKLEREAYRAFHAPTPLHKADHFFNFCVTAASMRDYLLEHLNLLDEVQCRPHYDAWSKSPALVAAVEIANSSKHFVLRDWKTKLPKPIKTRAVRLKKAKFFDVYVTAAGETKVIVSFRSEVTVTPANSLPLELYAFTGAVISYWKSYLATQGLRVRRQSFSHLAAR